MGVQVSWMQAPSAPAVRRVPKTSSLEHSKNILPFRSFTCGQSKDGSVQLTPTLLQIKLAHQLLA